MALGDGFVEHRLARRDQRVGRELDQANRASLKISARPLFLDDAKRARPWFEAFKVKRELPRRTGRRSGYEAPRKVVEIELWQRDQTEALHRPRRIPLTTRDVGQTWHRARGFAIVYQSRTGLVTLLSSFGAMESPRRGKAPGWSKARRGATPTAMAAQAHRDPDEHAVDPGAHAVLIVDQAGWHLDAQAVRSPTTSPSWRCQRKPRSPELNQTSGRKRHEQFMRDN